MDLRRPRRTRLSCATWRPKSLPWTRARGDTGERWQTVISKSKLQRSHTFKISCIPKSAASSIKKHQSRNTAYMMTTKVVNSPVYCPSFAFCSLLPDCIIGLFFSYLRPTAVHFRIAPFHPPLPPSIPSLLFFSLPSFIPPGTQHKAILIM